jgi:hypothetical protein
VDAVSCIRSGLSRRILIKRKPCKPINQHFQGFYPVLLRTGTERHPTSPLDHISLVATRACNMIFRTGHIRHTVRAWTFCENNTSRSGDRREGGIRSRPSRSDQAGELYQRRCYIVLCPMSGFIIHGRRGYVQRMRWLKTADMCQWQSPCVSDDSAHICALT